MVSQRQLAERQRVEGNALYSQKQYTAAFQCYDTGLEAEKHNMALHSNAAQVLINMGCYVQAIEHCDKVQSSPNKQPAYITTNNTDNIGKCSKGVSCRFCIWQSSCTTGQQTQYVQRLCGAEQLQERFAQAQTTQHRPPPFTLFQLTTNHTCDHRS